MPLFGLIPAAPAAAPVVAAGGGAAGVAGRTVVKKYIGAGGKLVVAFFLGKELIGQVDEEAGETADDLTNQLIEAGASVIDGALSELGGLSLDFLEGAGSAIVRGIEATYDTVRDKLRGREDNVIAGFTVGFIALLTIVYLYQSVKRGGDI